VNVLIEASLQDGRVKLSHHLVATGVGGRIGQLDRADAISNAVVHQRLFCCYAHQVMLFLSWLALAS
jgi:hypothetical protein